MKRLILKDRLKKTIEKLGMPDRGGVFIDTYNKKFDDNLCGSLLADTNYGGRGHYYITVEYEDTDTDKHNN